METRTCIETRRSVRKFTDQAVTPEVLGQIVAAAAWAPSWKNTQVVRYHAVCTKEIKDRIAEEGVLNFAWNTKIIQGAPVLVVMTMITGYRRKQILGTAITSGKGFTALLSDETNTNSICKYNRRARLETKHHCRGR